MNLSSTVRDLKAKLAAVEIQHKQLTDAIRALAPFSRTEATIPPAQPKKRRRHFVYNATCLRCGNLFKAKRHPAKNNPKRSVLFCHKPCNSTLYKQDQTKYASRVAMHATHSEKTILPGDPLRASTGQR